MTYNNISYISSMMYNCISYTVAQHTATSTTSLARDIIYVIMMYNHISYIGSTMYNQISYIAT